MHQHLFGRQEMIWGIRGMLNTLLEFQNSLSGDIIISTQKLSAAPIEYKPHSRFIFFAILGVIMTAVAGWELLRTNEFNGIQQIFREGLLFFVISLGIAIWAIWTLFSRVEVGNESVAVRNPLGQRKSVEYRQVVSAIESGRFGNSISLLYYPKGSDGLIDTDDADTLFLPKVQNQSDLLQHFRERIPA